MKFGIQFEFHKIPEWYTEYLDYLKFKRMIKDFKHRLKSKYILIPYSFIEGEVQKLRGLYYLTSSKRVIRMDIYNKLNNIRQQRNSDGCSDIEPENTSQIEFKFNREISKDDSFLLRKRHFYFD